MALLIIFLLVVAFASLLASPLTLYASSTPDGGFKAVLKHVDYAKRLTSNEHFQQALQRSMMRLESHKPKKQNGFTSGQVTSNNGEYFMNLSIGTPPRTYLALIDTDTDLIWTTCEPTTLCDASEKKCPKFQSPIYDSTKSKTYKKLKCNSAQCGLLANTSCNTTDNSCTYNYQYSGGISSFTRGDLANETFRSTSFNGKDSVANFTFGCANTISLDLGDLRSGFVGLGRGNLSLVSQINVNMFSLCLPAYDNVNKTGVVAFGDHAKTKTTSATVITDMLIATKHESSYYIYLKGIKVNGTSLDLGNTPFQIDEYGKGGIAMDTGMTVSYLREDVYRTLTTKLTSLIKLRKAKKLPNITLDLCFYLTKKINAGNVGDYLPTVAFTFVNGNRESDLVFPVGNAFRTYYKKVTCLAMAAAPATADRSSLGNMQLQDTLVVYDIAAKKVSFTPNTTCEKLM